MKLNIVKSLTVSLAISAAIALPATVKAQADNVSEIASDLPASSEHINTELYGCGWVAYYPFWACQ